ncbi:hypothetical protein [Streptomyces sp. 049-1]|uniref:hypothetical protein n=1 Tax=Streptomyces sp. 049-1 TaxID=2789264 RepID=UPI00397F11FA
MATKNFSFNTEPHVASVNGRDLLFEPEVMGDAYMDAFGELKEAQAAASGIDLDDLSTLDPSTLRGATRGLRQFLGRMMLPESAREFLTVEAISADGTVLSCHQEWEEAEEAAAQVTGARVRWTWQMPDRVLVDLMEWVTELYGGGSKARPTGRSGGSAKASARAGKSGPARSRSKG